MTKFTKENEVLNENEQPTFFSSTGGYENQPSNPFDMNSTNLFSYQPNTAYASIFSKEEGQTENNPQGEENPETSNKMKNAGQNGQNWFLPFRLSKLHLDELLDDNSSDISSDPDLPEFMDNISFSQKQNEGNNQISDYFWEQNLREDAQPPHNDRNMGNPSSNPSVMGNGNYMNNHYNSSSDNMGPQNPKAPYPFDAQSFPHPMQNFQNQFSKMNAMNMNMNAMNMNMNNMGMNMNMMNMGMPMNNMGMNMNMNNMNMNMNMNNMPNLNMNLSGMHMNMGGMVSINSNLKNLYENGNIDDSSNIVVNNNIDNNLKNKTNSHHHHHHGGGGGANNNGMPFYSSPSAPSEVSHHQRSVSMDSAFVSGKQNDYKNFSDDTVTLKKSNDLDRFPGAPVCRYFAAGFCNRGDRCNFVHSRRSDEKEVKETPKTKNKVQPTKGLVEADFTSKYTSIDQVVGQIYKMCKDQHGCRFLQKQLEEGGQYVVQIVFNEIYNHMVELMTDPFGNYLCQKLIEFCDTHQQLLIVQKVSSHLVSISKNMHGTRAVQKMIECLSTPNQIQLVVNSLKSSVVSLIQDLNGNHVIQRCLYRLSTQDKQFVYDAVAKNCVEVATHRHGCCVMQRCIDYASEEQKIQLVKEITNNVLSLVQDPFGNYVVQYVLDLSFMLVKVQLISQFLGHLSYLSTQKFSSNVIEKCLRVAEESVKFDLIEELMLPNVLPQLLQDPFGNYVIQTALAFASPSQKARLIEAIKPHLPNLRNAPYVKRIQNKINKEPNVLVE